MIITLPLLPEEETRLIEAAQAKGLSPDDLVREAVDKILADVPVKKKPAQSLYGLLAKYGPLLSGNEIDENRAEMLANFPRSDF